MYKIKIIFLCLFMLCISKQVSAQFDSTDTRLNDSLIVLDLTITIDSVSYYDTSYVLGIINFNNGNETLMRVSNHFNLYFEYNTKYEISILHPTTNCKAILIDTNAPKNKWLIISGFGLSKSINKEKVIVGSIVYDDSTKTFVKKKIE